MVCDCNSEQIVFVENKKLRSTLLADIDESQLPEIYGGKLQLVPIQDCWIRQFEFLIALIEVNDQGRRDGLTLGPYKVVCFGNVT